MRANVRQILRYGADFIKILATGAVLTSGTNPGLPEFTEDEIRASALQFVRKLSGTTKPSQANAAVFDRAVDEVTAAAHRLIHAFHTNAPPRDREEERRKAHERAVKRFGLS